MVNSFLNFLRSLISSDDLAGDACCTKFPIIFVHGICYRDDMCVSSWGKIPELVQQKKGQIFLSGIEAMASYKENAALLQKCIADVIDITGAEKVNLIAHSKGGIDARYAISKLGVANRVASLTTVSTPHRGTICADVVTGLIPDKMNSLYKIVDIYGRLLGDNSPDTAVAVKELTREHMKQFNDDVDNVPGVYYQSYGTHMLSPLNDPMFALSHELLNKYEGVNDGMVSEESYRWGDFQGVVQGRMRGIGISHLQITGSVGSLYSNVDIPKLYASWIERLKKKGF